MSAAANHAWVRRLGGCLIVFDGPDGCGKSTQIARLSEFCHGAGLVVTLVREPGGTAVGERIRQVLLDPVHAEMTLRAEMLLYMASRAQLVEERIIPARTRGELVLADRFVSSTLAYQGTAGGLAPEAIRAVAQIAVGDCRVDLMVLLDVDTDTAMSRVGKERDRMEQKDRAFHARVREGYLAQARNNPDGTLVVDASRGPDAVFAEICAGLRARLARL